MPLYLTDASIWIGARNRPGTYLPRALAERLRRDEIAVCVPTALEVLTGPQTGAEVDAQWDALWARLRWLPIGNDELERALDLLRSLAHTTAGAHRRRPIDYLVAACAAAARAAGDDIVLWHWDADLTVICDHAGIPHEAEHERAKEHGINRAPGQPS